MKKNIFYKIGFVCLVVSVLIIASFPTSFSQEAGSIEVDVKYQNGDRVDFAEMTFNVYQDNKDSPFLEQIRATKNPHIISSLPIGSSYTIEVYINGVYAGSKIVKLESSMQKVDATIPLPGGMSFFVYYDDGSTPIKNAFVSIRLADGTEIRKAITDDGGKTIRFWLQPTTRQADFYHLEVSLAEGLTFIPQPIKLQPGTAQDFKIVTSWPVVIDDLITVTVYNAKSKPVSTLDGDFVAELYQDGKKVAYSNVNSRGNAYFSVITVGQYELRITKSDPEQQIWATKKILLDGKQNNFDIFQPVPDSSATSEPKSHAPICNCVAFRLDDVQDFWLNEVQTGILNFFKEHSIPITIGVIGNSFGTDQKLLDYLKKESDSSLIEIANHGLEAKPITTLGKEKQSELIRQANKVLFDLFGENPTTFIPPLNEFNDDTLLALKENGFTHLSSNTIKDPPPYQLQNTTFYRFPESATTGVYDSTANLYVGLSHEKTFTDIMYSLDNYGFAVVTIHPQEFSVIENGSYSNKMDASKLTELEMLIGLIQKNDLSIVQIKEINSSSETNVPQWIKSNARWWSEGKISDSEFIGGLQYLVQNKIIIVPETKTTGHEQILPQWIKNNAKWWAEGSIDENAFVQAIQWLISNGILVV